jgi:tetratricopeptide (TPR) repeat protein
MTEQEMNETKQPVKEKKRLFRIVLFGLVAVLLLSLLGTYLGYRQGINIRMAKQLEQEIIAASAQFQLGLIDLENEQFEIAKKRFEYVIKVDPNFPGAGERLQEALVGLAISEIQEPTPFIAELPTETPTEEVEVEVEITPTFDPQVRDDLYFNAQRLIAEESWDEAIPLLDKLRLEYPDYLPLKVDGMYYIAYRNNGVKKILMDGNLEGGMYDLSIASRFGPLDWESDSYRSFARYYITGAAFWEVDWLQSIYYFGLVYEALPNLRDGSNFTTVRRYAIANMSYADLLVATGESCESLDYYQIAYDLLPNEEGLAEKFEEARNKCEAGEPVIQNTPTPEEEIEDEPIEEEEEPGDGGEEGEPTP